MSKNKIVCIAGASGLVGSHLVKECLKRGYKVRGTLTDATNKEKTKHLMELNNAKENLQLFSADMYEENSFDKVLKGVDAFFIACYVPVVKLKDGTSIKQLSDLEVWEKVLGPTKKATLNLLNSSKKNNVESIYL